jgi:hypothetical protein
MMATLAGFLKDGHLDGLQVGMLCGEVESLLGQPDDTFDYDPPLVWKYGSMQLAFDVRVSPRSGNRPEWHLTSITLYFHDPDLRLPKAIASADRAPDDLSFEGICAYLDANKIRVVGGIAKGPNKRLVLDSAVRANFDEDDRLYNVTFSAKYEPEIKQLTVKVTRKDFDLIKHWAKGRNVSASDLCTEWVKDRVSKLSQEMGTS